MGITQKVYSYRLLWGVDLTELRPLKRGLNGSDSCALLYHELKYSG